MNHDLSELRDFESKLDQAAKFGEVRQECMIEGHSCQLPIYSLRFGSKDVHAPTLAIVGGIHGLEKIGTRVVLAHLQHILESLNWDESLNELLANCRLLFYPLANPTGMLNGTRCNQTGIDLMRNAPVDRTSGSRLNLLAGHRISPLLPWFRGYGGEMEKEALTLIQFCQREVSQSVFSITIDVHSGFGFRDRIWFPYAKDRIPIHHVAEVYALRKLLRRSHRHHIYKFEPQCESYTTNGDLWDYIYDQHLLDYPLSTFLPLCLEMGSWNWVRKNPKQLLSAKGLYNPIIDHREHRTLRRHISLFDFLLRAARSHLQWLGMPLEQIEVLRRKAILKWYS